FFRRATGFSADQKCEPSRKLLRLSRQTQDYCPSRRVNLFQISNWRFCRWDSGRYSPSPRLWRGQQHYFFDFFGGSSRINDQETSAVWPLSYWTKKPLRVQSSISSRSNFASGEILFAARIVECGSRMQRPSSNSTSNASSQLT